MKNLVIVESAAKAKTIQKYLNSIPELKSKGSFTVIASMGHIQDLPAKEMGVDVATWEATYVPIPGKDSVVAKLRSAAKEADVVWLAADPDLEGEAIANHIKNVLKLKKPHRVTFSEITKNALREAILHPRSIDENKVQAQESRRILDRVVGYELSPLLWHRFATSKLSAGRVQSAALKMLVDRSLQAQEHVAEPYWTLEGLFYLASTKAELEAKAYGNDNKVATWSDEKDIRKLLRSLGKKASDATWIAEFTQKESKKSPSAPFTTSSLQQEAYTRLGLPAKRTMQLAQGLYEGGYITYMRTDSTALSEDAKAMVTRYIGEAYGTEYIQMRDFKTKAANAQEAHEAIRPSNVATLSKDLEGDAITSTHKKLYDLIWRRAVASQMTQAIYADVVYAITSSCCSAQFRGKYSVLIEEGYLKVYQPDLKANPGDLKKWAELLAKKKVEVKPKSFKAPGDVERPPSLYNEPGLVKAMEQVGIGRPSTYATIIDKLFSKGYVMKGPNPQKTVHVNTYVMDKGDITVEEETISLGGKEVDRFVPTSLGERVVEYLGTITPYLLETEFTANMEAMLDLLSEAKLKKKQVLTEFYKKFHVSIEEAQAEHKKRAAEKRKEAARKKKEGIVEEKEEKPLRPKNVLREFERIQVQIVQTRYGPALFHLKEGRFVSMMPYLRWRGKTMEELTERDVTFLFRLPMKFSEGNREIHLGRYGFYVKEGTVNIALPKELWDTIQDGTISYKDIKDLKPPSGDRPKRFFPRKQAAS